MKTKRDIKKIFETFADDHLQINSFMYDKDFNVIKKEDIVYPCLFVFPTSGVLTPESIQRVYRIVIADRVQKDEENQIDVETDTELILMDVFEYWYRLGQVERFNVPQQAVFTPFFDTLVDEVTGHYMDITIEEFRGVNSCTIPKE